MAFEIDLRSPAPPERVLGAIRENLREWRESKIPHDVRKDGVLRVVGDVEPPRFRMRFDRRWYWGEGGDPLVLAGEVVAAENGGSRVVARCGHPGYLKWVPLVFVPLLAWSLFGRGGVAWAILVTAGVFLALAALGDRSVSRGDRNAAYLAERLQDAVAAASESSALPR
ncbi:MAG TPA: hypothetical protein VFN38_09330 [Gemmatimonadaceae bacterium]|nr:hypothetical protein [Gemmatimonadaceae bacterium]